MEKELSKIKEILQIAEIRERNGERVMKPREKELLKILNN